MINNSFLIFGFLSSLGFLCVFKNKKKVKYGEEIPKIKDPHLILQFGCPKENPLTK